MKTVLAETALRQVLDVMETEDWDQLTTLLADDVELADELTATWLRGRDRVAAYLRAQTGIVTNITNTASDISSRMIGDRVLVTFSLRQRYLLEGVTRRERLTGCAIFETDVGLPLLTLFHLGEADSAAEQTGESARAAINSTTEEPLGVRIRERRSAAGLSLRGLAARSGLSASFLSQLERSKADPNVSSLRQLADGLGTTVGDLLGGPAAQRSTRSRIDLRDLGMMIDVFLSDQPASLDARITELQPDAATTQPLVSSVERFIYVLGGTLAVTGSEPAILHAGEGAYLAAGRTRVQAHGKLAARFLSVQARAEEQP